MNHFLTASELALIAQDHSDLLASEEMSDVVIHYSTPLGPVTEDPVYHTKSASGYQEVELDAKALQHVVKPQNYDVTRWGILKQGDAVFYFSPTVDLSGIQDDNAYIMAGGLKWQPVPRANQAFYNFLVKRIGNQQFVQAIPCKLVDEVTDE